MEVNDELAVLRRAMPAAIDAIAVGGRVVVESYHSLEDRLVKQAFAAVDPQRRSPSTCPSSRRAASPPLRLVTRGAEKADADEIAAEPPRRLGPAARGRTRPSRTTRGVSR